MEELKETLKEIGLSESESQIYLTLLKKGEISVAEISQISGLHRTNIYDCLEKLKEKGFVSYLLKNNKQAYRASEPNIILDYFKEKENKISRIIPELNKLKESIKEKVSVEIFKGEEGLKTALRDILKDKQEVIGYNISGQLRKFMPKFSEYYFIEQEKHKIKHRFIYTIGTPKPPTKYYEIKFLPKEYSNPTITLCYGGKILNLIFEPEMIAIRIKSNQLAEAQKKHFNLLWKIAKKP
jgi:sugar-specific transcriptional regulator TrmB